MFGQPCPGSLEQFESDSRSNRRARSAPPRREREGGDQGELSEVDPEVFRGGTHAARPAPAEAVLPRRLEGRVNQSMRSPVFLLFLLVSCCLSKTMMLARGCRLLAGLDV
eukprot:993670-Alexandrium_andersonii.AAC.1